MGDPRRLRKQYDGPVHPWQSERIKQEKALVYEFGLKNKKELWRSNSQLKNFANQAKRLIALRTKQAESETKQVLTRLAKLGLLSDGAELNDVLGLQVQDILSRRLQTVLIKKGLARTAKQARQFIVHGHVQVQGKTISSPGYLVPVAEESEITFSGKSKLSNPEHPERELKSQVVVTTEEAKETEESEAQA